MVEGRIQDYFRVTLSSIIRDGDTRLFSTFDHLWYTASRNRYVCPGETIVDCAKTRYIPVVREPDPGPGMVK